VVTQPEALRFADALEATDQMHSNADLTSGEVAAELRRLHELNQELVKALQEATRCLAWHEEKHGVGMDRLAVEKARAAIAKATGGGV